MLRTSFVMLQPKCFTHSRCLLLATANVMTKLVETYVIVHTYGCMAQGLVGGLVDWRVRAEGPTDLSTGYSVQTHLHHARFAIGNVVTYCAAFERLPCLQEANTGPKYLDL